MQRADSQVRSYRNIRIITKSKATISSPNDNFSINNENSLTVNCSNPSGNDIAYFLDCPNGTRRLFSGKTKNTSWTWSEAQILSMLQYLPNSNSSSIKVGVITYGNAEYYSEKAGTLNVVNSNPVFTNFTFKDANSKVVALTGNDQTLVKDYSNVIATITSANKAIAKNGASMKIYKMQIGNSITNPVNYSANDITLNLNNVSSNSIIIYATDSRNNSTSVIKNASIKNYSRIICNELTTPRTNNGIGEGVILNAKGTFWNASFGKTTNTIKSINYYYKRTGTNDWVKGTTALTLKIDGTNWSVSQSIAGDLEAKGFNVSETFDIKIELNDELSTDSKQSIVGSGEPAIAIYKNNVAIGKKYDTNDGSKLQVKGKVTASGDITSASNIIAGNDVKGNGFYSMDTGNAGTPVGNGRLVIKRVNNYEAPNNGVVLEFGNSKAWTGQLFIGDNSTQGIYFNGWSGGTRGSWHRLAQEDEAYSVTLYDNASGSNGTITLSDNAGNYNFIQVFWFNTTPYNKNARNSAIYANINNQCLSLASWEPNEGKPNVLHFTCATYRAVNNALTPLDYLSGYVTDSSFSYYGSIDIKIYKVLGYKRL